VGAGAGKVSFNTAIFIPSKKWVATPLQKQTRADSFEE
jgi:hypothetical protein